jgi:hypothetical protein
MKNKVFCSASRAYVVFCTVAVCLSTSIFAVIANSNFSGAAYTTNSSGAWVNENLYQVPQDVYVNGGPNNANSQGLPPNEVFYFEVTDPSGKLLLSTDSTNCRQVQTDANGRVAGVYTGDGCGHDVGTTDVSNGALPVKLWPFNRTPNDGNEYKVVLVRKTAPGVSVESDGFHLDYPRSATKTDNFKVVTFPSPTPTPTPVPTPPGGNGGGTGGGGDT